MSELEPPRLVTDAETLRVLAHPLRQRILRRLREFGAATSTTLAKALGENTGATSYHLRLLARHDLVEEAPELAKGRERWWRSRRLDLRFPPPGERTEEFSRLFHEWNQALVASDVERFARSHAETPPDEWAEATPFSRAAITCTPEELGEFFDAYLDLVRRFAEGNDDDKPPNARRMLLRFFAFPDPSQ